MFRVKLVTSVLLGVLLVGCGGSDEGNGGGSSSGDAGDSGADGSGTGGGDGGDGVADGSAGEGGESTEGTGSTDDTGGTDGSGSGTGTGSSDGTGTVENECAAVWTETQSVPAMLEFVIDKSTSMNDSSDSTGGQSKWEATRDALTAAFPTMSSDLAVGEFFFPNEQEGCVQEDVGGVSLAPLDAAQVQALQDGVAAVENPTDITGTPTHDAWREGLRQLQETLAAPPPGFEAAKGYIVLVTDGMPVKTLGCGEADGDNIAVTEEQFDELMADVGTTASTTGIQTFVIGVPGSELTNQVPSGDDGELDYLPRTKLSELAAAGMTAASGCSNDGPNYCHIDMTDPSIDFVAALTAAIGTISVSVGSCEYPVPQNTDPSLIVDPFKPLTVNYFAGGGTAATELPQNPGCVGGTGWDYADANESSIILCSGTCDTIRADAAAEVRVSLGCVPVG